MMMGVRRGIFWVNIVDEIGEGAGREVISNLGMKLRGEAHKWGIKKRYRVEMLGLRGAEELPGSYGN